jgi:hypothetical protein
MNLQDVLGSKRYPLSWSSPKIPVGVVVLLLVELLIVRVTEKEALLCFVY